MYICHFQIFQITCHYSIKGQNQKPWIIREYNGMCNHHSKCFLHFFGSLIQNDNVPLVETQIIHKHLQDVINAAQRNRNHELTLTLWSAELKMISFLKFMNNKVDQISARYCILFSSFCRCFRAPVRSRRIDIFFINSV